MTKAEIVAEVLGRMNLSTTQATERVEGAVDRHNARITAEMGLEMTRFVTRNQTTTNGVQTVTFTSIEKIDRVIDGTDSSAIRVLEPVSVNEIRSTQPGTSEPTKWALYSTTADSITILIDTLPQDSYTLHADGLASADTLADDDEPTFPKSFHDIITWNVLSEELLKKGATHEKLALIYERKADVLLGKLRFHLNDHPVDLRQNDSTLTPSGTGSGGGGGNAGTDAYTQSALITFATDIALSGADRQIRQSTSDGSDDKRWTLSGGGSRGTDRGAFIDLFGNEHFSTGRMSLYPGNVSGGRVEIYRQDGSLALFIDSAGKVEVSFGQIGFPASQNASSNVNTLDDYEEGTFTPTLTGSGGSSGQAYTTQLGRYCKIGKRVWVDVYLVMSTLGTVTGDATIAGLPFTSVTSNALASGTVNWAAMTSSFVTMTGVVNTGATTAKLFGATAAATGLTALAQADLSNTSAIRLSVCYEASA